MNRSMSLNLEDIKHAAIYKEPSYSTVFEVYLSQFTRSLCQIYVLIPPINTAHPHLQLGSALVTSWIFVMTSGVGVSSPCHSGTISGM